MKKLFTFLAALLILNSSFLIHNCMCQWQADERMTNDPATSFTSDNNARCVASSGNFVHVVWWDLLDGNYEIYYKRSTDGGISWGINIRLTNNNANSFRPSVSVSGQVVHVVWYDFRHGSSEIYYKRSTDGGVTWGADIRLTNNSGESYRPSLSVSGTNVHVVWYDTRDGNSEIYYKRSTDGGTSWGGDTRLTNDPASSEFTSVSVSGSDVHVAWYDYRDGYFQIYYKRSTDGGVMWETDIRLTNVYATLKFPSVAVSGSVVHVVWEDSRDGNWEIYYKRSTDGGVIWEPDARLTNNPGGSYQPNIAVSGQIVHVVWYDTRDGNNEIYNKRSLNGGVSWEPETRLTNNLETSNNPSITVSDSVVHVVWYDYRDGNFEIYYKRNPTGNLVGIINLNSEIPPSFSLSQNYPNPFNITSNLKFQIGKANASAFVNLGHVKLIVYDIMGKEVQTLVNEKLQPGTYEATFDGSRLGGSSTLNSGVYFYKLSVGDFSETKKMLMIK